MAMFSASCRGGVPRPLCVIKGRGGVVVAGCRLRIGVRKPQDLATARQSEGCGRWLRDTLVPEWMLSPMLPARHACHGYGQACRGEASDIDRWASRSPWMGGILVT